MSNSTIKDAVFWQILVEIQRVLRTEITFNSIGEDGSLSISQDAIAIRKYKAPKPGSPAEISEVEPGLIISPGRCVRPPMEGTNAQDEADYTVFIQIIDKDYDNQFHNLRTHLKWQEQIVKLMNHWFASHQICNPNDCVRDNVATGFDVGDEKMFVRHQNFVAGVMVVINAWEGRGPTDG